MIEIPSSLRSLFSAPIEEQDGTYIIEVPSSEVEYGAVTADETYRVAIFESPTSAESSIQQGPQQRPSRESVNRAPSEPLVDEGEVRDLTIEIIGDQGDGIAKVERGETISELASRGPR
ncbi:deoxyribonuclease [Saliphagus sp. GCM10025334]